MKPSGFNDSKTFGFCEIAAFLDFCFINKLGRENSLVVENEDGSRTLYFNSQYSPACALNGAGTIKLNYEND